MCRDGRVKGSNYPWCIFEWLDSQEERWAYTPQASIATVELCALGPGTHEGELVD